MVTTFQTIQMFNGDELSDLATMPAHVPGFDSVSLNAVQPHFVLRLTDNIGDTYMIQPYRDDRRLYHVVEMPHGQRPRYLGMFQVISISVGQPWHFGDQSVGPIRSIEPIDLSRLES